VTTKKPGVLSAFGAIADPVTGDLTSKARPTMADVDQTRIYFYDVAGFKAIRHSSGRALPSPRQIRNMPRLEALNFPLGAIYTSKLMTELRVNKGYTYGIRSGRKPAIRIWAHSSCGPPSVPMRPRKASKSSATSLVSMAAT